MIQHYRLDTNMVSHIITRQSIAARARLASLSPGAIACVSTITEGDLRYGLAKLPRGLRLQGSTDWLLGRLRILPWRSEEAQACGAMRTRQEQLGGPLQSIDMLIAAHALAARATLVTRDKVFHQVEGLAHIENWATDL